MNKLTQYLTEPFLIEEGVNDPGILKAVFLAGGPGSGKSFVAGHLYGIPSKVSISAYGLKLVNQDKELTRMLKKYGFGTDLDDMPDELFKQLTDPTYDDYSGLRGRAKEITAARKKLYMKGRLGMIVDGTGHKFGKIRKQKMELEEIGYDCYMVFVDTSLEIAQARNMERARKLKPSIVEDSWKDVQKNKEAFNGLFSRNFIVVNNNDTLKPEAAEKKFNMLVKKGIGSFIRKGIQNSQGKKWIEKQRIMKEDINIPVKVGDTILVGKFKNKKMVIKDIGKDKHGMPTINGRKATTFRIHKTVNIFDDFDEEVKEEFGAPSGFLPSPSRKGINKNKTDKKSGYKKVDESKAELYKLYKQAMKAMPGSPNQKKIKKQIAVLRKKLGMNEQKSKIKKVIGVFGGRFQPFHSGHLATYKWLKSRVDEAYVTTSDIKQPPRHPLNFKEKKQHIIKMGVPKNRIVEERTPYVAKNLLKDYDSETTAVIYIVGEKDAGRLSSGKYFQSYKKHKNNLQGFGEHGYTLSAPQVGNVSGTQMRKLLGDPKIDDSARQKLFKKSFGYYDKKVYSYMTKSFRKLFESLILTDELIEEFLLEATNTTAGNLDDGPSTFYKDYSAYKKVSKEWLDSMYEKAGWKVIDYILSDKAENSVMNDYKSVALTYLDHGQAGGSTSAVSKYKKWMTKVVKPLGWEIVDWMGTDSAINNIIGTLFSAGADGDIDFDEDSLFERFNLNKEVQLLTEGGAYGHLSHPFDDKNLTFRDFKNIVINTLQGKLDREGPVTEKTDGQNIMISWKNGKLIAARNKGHIKNHGAAALDLGGIKNMFAGRGDIEKAFVFAIRDLQRAISGLSDKQKNKIFGEGSKFMSLEIIYPKTANVIPYDKSLLQFHGTIEYDANGSPIGSDRGSAKILEGMIRQINQNIQKTFKIDKPFVANLPQVKDFSQRQSYFLGKLNKLQKEFGLKDNDTLADYHQAYWMEYIYNGAKQFKYNLPNNILVKLTRRWAFLDKSYKIQQMKKDFVKYPKFLDWVLKTDKMDLQKLQKQHIRDWEVLFFELGAEVLKNLQSFIAANPDRSVQKIKKDLTKTITQVRKAKDPSKLEMLKTQLDRLKALGGFKSIIPSEGVTFVYKGKLYKYTGAFAPVNQILGMLKFTR